FGYDPRIINESNALPIDSPPIRRVAPGEQIRVETSSAHFSTRKYENVCLSWHLGGMDTRGRLHQDLVAGQIPIPFPHRHVAHAHTLEFCAPLQAMLCTLLVEAHAVDGNSIARNFVQYFVSKGYPPEREELPRALVLRGTPANWSNSEWSGGSADRHKERAEDCCYGFGHGFFEWLLPLSGADIRKAHRIKILCEASSHRIDAPQTDADTFPTTMQMSLNDVRVYDATLRNHPHDARGVLSYWRGGVGGYGYLAHAVAEKDALAEIARNTAEGTLRLRCSVPADAVALGGLTIYGAECGRYPVCPTVIIEW
ncbi:MAG TPA: glycoside hydrolase family 2, partial [Candidatus Dormibacteraeota bacterium]|nr:glycoside hydrolase family 2 [Candidatus Dormibacteraeota bacterium]